MLAAGTVSSSVYRHITQHTNTYPAHVVLVAIQQPAELSRLSYIRRLIVAYGIIAIGCRHLADRHGNTVNQYTRTCNGYTPQLD
jgi:hypothetical protein